MSDNPDTAPPAEPIAPPPDAAPEPTPEPAPDPSPEPQLSALIRFEAGEVGDLVEHFKQWVEWRLSQLSPK